MKYKETIEELDPEKQKEKEAKEKKKKERKSKKFSFKETIVSGSNSVKGKAKKTKEEVNKLRTEAFVNTRMLWRPYALMIGDYFTKEYNRNFSYLFDKLSYFNKKKALTRKDMDQLEVIISINELKYYVKDDDKYQEIDINDDLITRDFFINDLDKKVYKELIEESDKKYKHSISYLLKLYNLLISFVKEKEVKEVFYKVTILGEHKEEISKPLVLNEKIIDVLPIHEYLSNKYNKKLRDKYDY